MRQRPTALGFASLLALLAPPHVGTSAEAALVVGGGSPAKGPHNAPNHNSNSSGSYASPQNGFNLADLRGVSTLNALPSGVKGLVWLGLCKGADSSFINAVTPFIGNPKLF